MFWSLLYEISFPEFSVRSLADPSAFFSYYLPRYEVLFDDFFAAFANVDHQIIEVVVGNFHFSATIGTGHFSHLLSIYFLLLSLVRCLMNYLSIIAPPLSVLSDEMANLVYRVSRISPPFLSIN